MDIEKHVDGIIDTLPEMVEGSETTLAGSRQILDIRNAVFISAGFRVSTAEPIPKSKPILALNGDPSPSSEVTRGFVRFVPKSELKVPTYSTNSKLINLWIDESYMPMVLEQMKHTKRYLWIGFFNNGHTYSDIHSVA